MVPIPVLLFTASGCLLAAGSENRKQLTCHLPPDAFLLSFIPNSSVSSPCDGLYPLNCSVSPLDLRPYLLGFLASLGVLQEKSAAGWQEWVFAF